MSAVKAAVDAPQEAEPALRHIVVAGGTLAEWAGLSDHQWQQRLADLGKVADHVGASWLTIRPYEAGQAAVAASSVLAERLDTAGGCMVLASSTADGRARMVTALVGLQRDGAVIDETSVAARLNAPAEADPDLVVVLGPAHRLPPSLVWELAYSELVFLDVAWEHLQPRHLEGAIEAYAHRHRRFGGLD
jgi:hypothetical protein